MNERIKALAVEAGLSIRGHYDESGSTPAELQKFAELIIKDQQREWVGLTDEEALDCQAWSVSNIARNAEAKLKEKNT
jgi:hypothetical protein